MLTAACVMWTRTAAAVKVRASAMAAKAFSCLMSIIVDGQSSMVNRESEKLSVVRGQLSVVSVSCLEPFKPGVE
jgi:hypothetical protein